MDDPEQAVGILTIKQLTTQSSHQSPIYACRILRGSLTKPIFVPQKPVQ